MTLGLFLWVSMFRIQVRIVTFRHAGEPQLDGKPGETKNPCSSAA